MTLLPFQIEAVMVLFLFLGVSGAVVGLRAASRATGWRVLTQILGVGLGVVFLALGVMSSHLPNMAWMSGLYGLFGAVQIAVFWRRDGAARSAFFMNGIGIALAGAWIALGPSISVSVNGLPFPPERGAMAITGAIIAAIGAALAFQLRAPAATARGELA